MDKIARADINQFDLNLLGFFLLSWVSVEVLAKCIARGLGASTAHCCATVLPLGCDGIAGVARIPLLIEPVFRSEIVGAKMRMK